MMRNSMLKLIEKLASHQCTDGSGFEDCPHCSAAGWGFIEHDKDCPILTARILLKQCRHGFPGHYNHGQGVCPPAS